MGSLILMGFSEVHPSLWRCIQCAVESWDRIGVGAGQFASLNPLHLHERGSSKLGGLVRVQLHLQGLRSSKTCADWNAPQTGRGRRE